MVEGFLEEFVERGFLMVFDAGREEGLGGMKDGPNTRGPVEGGVG